MMNKRFNQGMLAWLCALLMLVLPVGAAAQEAADDPVAVRVGEFTYNPKPAAGVAGQHAGAFPDAEGRRSE